MLFAPAPVQCNRAIEPLVGLLALHLLIVIPAVVRNEHVEMVVIVFLVFLLCV